MCLSKKWPASVVQWDEHRLVIRRLRVWSPPGQRTFFLWPFAPFCWFKKNSCQFLAKEWSFITCISEKKIWLLQTGSWVPREPRWSYQVNRKGFFSCSERTTFRGALDMLRLANELDGGKHAYSMNVLTIVELQGKSGYISSCTCCWKSVCVWSRSLMKAAGFLSEELSFSFLLIC